MYDEFFAKASELVQEGKAFVTATVVHATKPTSGKPGDKAIVTIDGAMHGWIGGSCAQPTVIKEALKALSADESRLIRLSSEPEEEALREGIISLPMTCYSGGTLEVFLEPQHPRPRLLIVGSLPVAHALSHLGQAMNYHVIGVDVDSEQAQTIHADEVLQDLGEISSAIRPFTFVVVATHGNYDELALEKILRANPTYVGLVASRKRTEAVRSYLMQQGVTETELLPLKAPAGLNIQARRGDEIALSIMAEIVQRRRNAELLDLALFHEAGPGEVRREDEMEKSAEIAIDPICHMEVEIATAVHVSEFEGKPYYFCCAGCQTTFENNPTQYVTLDGPSGMVNLGDIDLR